MKPTQVAYPWRATVRTALAYIVGTAVVLPLVWTAVQQTLGAYLSPAVAAAIGWTVALLVAVSTAVTRVMAIPAVNAWLTRVLDLGAAPAKRGDGS